MRRRCQRTAIGGRRTLETRAAHLDNSRTKAEESTNGLDKISKPGRRPRARTCATNIGHHRRDGRDHFNRIRVELEELSDDDGGVEADGLRVRTDESPTKDARRPMRHIISLERLQEGNVDLRLLSDRREGNLLSFTLLAQSSAETFRHAAHLAGHDNTQPGTMTLGEEISRGSEPVRDGHRAASGEAAPSGKGSYTLRTESTNMCDAVQAGIMAERTPASSRPPRLRCIVSR